MHFTKCQYLCLFFTQGTRVSFFFLRNHNSFDTEEQIRALAAHSLGRAAVGLAGWVRQKNMETQIRKANALIVSRSFVELFNPQKQRGPSARVVKL